MKNVNIDTNVELNVVVDLLVQRVIEVLELPKKQLAILVANAHKDNINNTSIMLEAISSMDMHKVLTFISKNIILSAVKEVPRTVIITQIAELYHNTMTPTNRFRLAAVLLRLFEITEAFGTIQKTNMHGFHEYIIVCKQKLSNSTLEELRTSVWKLPKVVISKANSVKLAGHYKKLTNINTHMEDVLSKLNNVSYTLDSRVWDKFKWSLASYRFSDMPVQQAFVNEGDKLVGKVFYFNHRFGADNGRIYCDGDLFTLQGGALNYVYKFSTKRVLTSEGLIMLRAHVNELHNKSSLSFKEQVELYSLSLDLIDAEAGLPVGTILHKDAKLSGLQHQAIATRSRDLAQYCGLVDNYSDGYNHLKSSLSNGDDLTRDMVKCAFNPYQYGAGALATVTPVEVLGGTLNYKEWEAAYSKAFPEAFSLRAFLVMLSSKYRSDVYEFTSPSGYNCVLTGLGVVETQISTVYGKLSYTRKEIDKEYMGVKLVAAFSHMQDAATLHTVVRKSTYDIHVVHDSFGVHPNDISNVMDNYVWTLREHLAMPILKRFVQEVLRADDAFVTANVSKYISNTLKPIDIVGGLF